MNKSHSFLKLVAIFSLDLESQDIDFVSLPPNVAEAQVISASNQTQPLVPSQVVWWELWSAQLGTGPPAKRSMKLFCWWFCRYWFCLITSWSTSTISICPNTTTCALACCLVGGVMVLTVRGNFNCNCNQSLQHQGLINSSEVDLPHGSSHRAMCPCNSTPRWGAR